METSVRDCCSLYGTESSESTDVAVSRAMVELRAVEARAALGTAAVHVARAEERSAALEQVLAETTQQARAAAETAAAAAAESQRLMARDDELRRRRDEQEAEEQRLRREQQQRNVGSREIIRRGRRRDRGNASPVRGMPPC